MTAQRPQSTDGLDPAIAAANKEMLNAGLQIANSMAALFGSMAGATAAAMMSTPMAMTPPQHGVPPKDDEQR